VGVGSCVSCFALPDSFSAVPKATRPVFMFCVPVLVFGCSEGVGSRFHALRSSDTFSAVPRVSDLVFMFCVSRLVFGGTVGVRSRFHFLRSRKRYRRRGGRQVPFSDFALPESFSAVPRVSGAVFMFCAPVLVFGGTDGVGSRFHVLRSRTRFRRCGGRRVPFSCFALPNSFSAVSRASGAVFMLCVPILVFDGTEGVGSRFHVLRSRTHFQRYRGRRFTFSCFACPN
jgi:hypothetical protein